MSAILRSLGLAASLALLASPAANASLVSYDESTKTLTYKASKGEANELTLKSTQGNRRVSIRDENANVIDVSGLCARPEPDDWHHVSCRKLIARRIRVLLGDKKDTATLTIVSGRGRVTVDAGDGNDQVVVEGASNTHLLGGLGIDWLINTDARGRLNGGGQSDMLIGGTGPDVLVGGPGPDALYGKQGRDLLIAKDGGTEDLAIDCGPSSDKAIVDKSEAGLAGGCEWVGPVVSLMGS